MPKIVALYKTWKGEEFVDSSVESIYNHVENIVMVHSNVSWDGTHHPNTVLPVIAEWSSRSDKCNKIINLVHDTQSQSEQYAVGMNYIKNNIRCDYIMLIDTDEVWDDTSLSEAVKIITAPSNSACNAFCCKLHTYIKSPFYRVSPIEMCKPTVFVRGNVDKLSGVRGNGVRPSMVMDVFMHHFTLVRNNIRTIEHKIRLSSIGDGNPNVDMQDWFTNKWEKLGNDPSVRNFHISKNYERSWRSLVKVTKNDLPEVFRLSNKPIIQKFEYLDKDLVERHSVSYEVVKSDAGSFSLDKTRNSEEYKLIIKHVPQTSSVLEIGTLNGRNLLCMAQDGFAKLTGVELIAEAAQWAIAKGKELNLDIEFIHAVYPTKLVDGRYYDRVVVFDTLEHVANVGYFLESIKGSLSDNGELLILVPQGLNYYDPVHINFYPTVATLENVLSMYFEVIETDTIHDGKKIFARCTVRK
jgi:2-polyprenyl-3-methyl-5-hydroxy-6-metoxy-1,4-benzoquinol methylase